MSHLRSNGLKPLSKMSVTGGEPGAEFETKGEAAPRIVIRGLDSQPELELDLEKIVFKIKSGFDWMAGTARGDFNLALNFLRDYFGCSGVLQNGGFNGYERRWEIVPGCTLNFDVSAERRMMHNCTYFVQFNGSVLSTICSDEHYDLLCGLLNVGLEFTRLDIRIDDYNKCIHPVYVFNCAEDGNYFGMRRHGLWYDHRRNKQPGVTVEFGRRGKSGNGVYIRYYDKFVESKGEYDCFRWETCFFKDRAQKIALALAATGGGLAFFKHLCACATSPIDFRERGHDPNRKRCPRLAWWERFIKSFGEADVSPKRKDTDMHRKRNWHRHQVSTSLYQEYQVWKRLGKESGFDVYIQRLVELGSSRATPEHERQINEDVRQWSGCLIRDRLNQDMQANMELAGVS